MKKTTLSALKAGSAPVVLGLALLSTQAFAQDAAEAVPEDSNVIVVTGSLIQNPNVVSTSPVSVIGEEEISLRQVTLAEDVLRQIPGAVPNVGQNVNNGNGGASYVDLRGLGSFRNIVLLDGARIVPSGTAGRVDLNNIPLALIQRVDALTGGASTTYGADAVSGVVNFITRKNFAGAELSMGTQITEKGDGFGWHADLTLGANFEDGRGNAVLSVGYQSSDALYQGDRDISIFGVSSTSGVASGSSPTSTPTTFGFADENLQVSGSGANLVAPYAPFNFNPYNVFVTPFKRYNIYSAARYEISDAVEVYTRGMFSRNTVASIVAPSGIFGEELTIQANNPFLNSTIRDQLCGKAGIPLGATCNTSTAIPLGAVYRRSVEVGPRIDEYVTDMFDYRAGVRGNITEKVQYDLWGSYGQSTNTQARKNYVSTSRVVNALNLATPTTCVAGGTCVPLNLFGPPGSITPAMASYIGGITSTIARDASLGQVHGTVSSEFGNFFSDKPINVAIGGEYRKYTSETKPDALAQVPGELGGAGGAIPPVKGGYDVKELFGEVNMPIISDAPFFHELTLEAGIRQSWYHIDAAGDPKFSATTWKAGLTWSPIPDIKFRGNYSHSVRAPNIAELFAPVSTGLTNLGADPCAGAAPNSNPNLKAVCLAQGAPAASIGVIQDPAAGQANSYGGGNPALKPETAKSYTFGVVLAPSMLSNLTLTVDYYNIKITGAVSAPTPNDVIAACFGTLTASSATSAACTGIRRNPTTGRLSGSSATTPGLPTPLSNLGRLATDGVDFTANYRTDLGFGKLSLSLGGNWTNHSTFQATPTSFDRECVGYYSANCASIQPKWQWFQRTTLTVGAIDLSLAWRHTSAAQYEGQASDFAARGFTATNRNLFKGTIKNANASISSPLAGRSVDFNHIGAYDYFDLATKYSIGDNFELTLAVTNLFNKQPPVVGSAAGSTSFNSGNTYPSSYDAVGRRFAAGAKLKF
ncbi:TonB-dependent receptor domain-containing protein [Novosphingobium sp.]|uniref:TonB-dependent receptor domain-containing protein n=1 Tax=Novosphingobium sp. TaxID=1874826 RepID=UPI00286E18FA|nr:TonB-dependent receptor [Novosphingobium sp.]